MLRRCWGREVIWRGAALGATLVGRAVHGVTAWNPGEGAERWPRRSDPSAPRAPSASRRSAPPAAPPRPARQQPESLRLRSMAAPFTGNDLPKSVAWYRAVLGFTPGERWETNAGLRGR